jgi:hypothetical protein
MKKPLSISFSMLLAATGWAATSPVPPTAAQVLDEFARTQDRLLSMVYTVTTTEEVAKGNRFYLAEVRTDANRAASREYGWGPGMADATSRADPICWVFVSDGKIRCRYLGRVKRPGTLNIAPARVKQGSPDSARRAILGYNNAGYLFGHFGSDEDCCDVVLRNASELRVRNQPEKVNGAPCWVLEAWRTYDNTVVQYTLWFDPAHGYNIARADVRAALKGESPAAIFRVNQVEFRQVDGVWVPASAEADDWKRNLRDGSTSSSRIHVRVTASRANPKDEPANAFTLNDVPDGSRVELVGDAYHSGKATMQNGRVVDAAGNVMLTPGAWQKGRALDAKGNVFWTPESLAGTETDKRPQTGQSGGADKPASAGKK